MPAQASHSSRKRCETCPSLSFELQYYLIHTPSRLQLANLTSGTDSIMTEARCRVRGEVKVVRPCGPRLILTLFPNSKNYPALI